jgi:hypothetical protein
MILGRLFARGRRDANAPSAQTAPKAIGPGPEISPARLDAALERLRAETPEPPPAEPDEPA